MTPLSGLSFEEQLPESETRKPASPCHIMAKPIGPACNLACRYCFYLEKIQLYRGQSSFRMPPEVLESFIRQHIAMQDDGEVAFTWQGGEPTLMGIDFFKEVVRLQKQYADGKKVTNAVQTNGVLLDDDWCELFIRHDFLVGVSIDGPRELHDRYRLDRQDRSTFDAVRKGITLLKQHGIRFNTLTVVNNANARQPLEVYQFLKEIGDGFMQFIPLVERLPDATARDLGLQLEMPPGSDRGPESNRLTPWSVRPKDLAAFYIGIFDRWVAEDVGSIFVQLFDVALGNWLGAGAGLCQFAPTCGHAVALEHNGDIYACDHYVYPQYRIGNLLKKPLSEIVADKRQIQFGRDKQNRLTKHCHRCDVLLFCHGDCPKHRFAKTPEGEPGLSYLCPAYKRIFAYMQPFIAAMGHLLQSGQPAAKIMDRVAAADRQVQFASAGRNDPCPCGSGRKFKKCCGA